MERIPFTAGIPALVGAALLLGACATVPQDLQPVPEVQPEPAEVRAQPDAFINAEVVWGGTVVSVANLPEGTRVEIVSRPLSRERRPLVTDRSDGRFHAFHPGFLDPQVLAPRREVTVRGRITGVTEGRIGEFSYAFPTVEAEVVHLWPVREPEPRVIYRDPFWDPWGPWGPYWGHPWRRGWW